jgi:hypothetical protein
MHFHCRSIRRADDPHERALGFRCGCGGHEREWRVPLTDFRHYDPSMLSAMELLIHADDEDNWEARRSVDTTDMARMGIEVAQVVTRRGDFVKKLEKDRDKARRKARILLKRHVSNGQWKEFLKKKTFHVTGSDGRLYRLSHQIGSSVTLVVEGEDVSRYCLVPKGDVWIPEADMMLAIKLMLETNARSFLRRANMTELRPARLRRTG